MTIADSPVAVDVVMATHNSAKYIEACLNSLNCIASPWRLIVADNASSDDTIARVQGTVRNATIVRNTSNLGFGQAINAGISRGSGEIILVLNPDATLAADPSPLFDIVRREDVILSGLMTAHDGSLRPNGFRFPTWCTILKASKAHIPSEEILRELVSSDTTSVDYVEGSFVVVRRETMARLQGFSPSYFMYGEDRDLCRRALALGVPTKIADRISHRHDGGFSPRRQPWYVEGLLTYVRQNVPRNFGVVLYLLRVKFAVKLVRSWLRSDNESVAAARATLDVMRRVRRP